MIRGLLLIPYLKRVDIRLKPAVASGWSLGPKDGVLRIPETSVTQTTSTRCQNDHKIKMDGMDWTCSTQGTVLCVQNFSRKIGSDHSGNQGANGKILLTISCGNRV